MHEIWSKSIRPCRVKLCRRYFCVWCIEYDFFCTPSTVNMDNIVGIDVIASLHCSRKTVLFSWNVSCDNASNSNCHGQFQTPVSTFDICSGHILIWINGLCFNTIYELLWMSITITHSDNSISLHTLDISQSHSSWAVSYNMESSERFDKIAENPFKCAEKVIVVAHNDLTMIQSLEFHLKQFGWIQHIQSGSINFRCYRSMSYMICLSFDCMSKFIEIDCFAR